MVSLDIFQIGMALLWLMPCAHWRWQISFSLTKPNSMANGNKDFELIGFKELESLKDIRKLTKYKLII